MVSTILVTGGAGFIGSALVRMLLRASRHTVVNVDLLTYAGNLDSIPDAESSGRYEFEHADICDAERVGAIISRFRPHAVINLAAESHVDRSIDAPAEFIRTNLLGTFTLLQQTLRYWQSMSEPDRSAFRFIHVSTDEVFGSLGPEGAFNESTPYAPNSPYSASKAGSDHLVRAWYHTYGLPTIITNCSNNYGPYQFPEKLIPLMILNAWRGVPLPVYGNGENIRDWLYVDDHCRALIAALERGVPGCTYTVGGSNEWRNIDVVTRICTLLDEIAPNAAIGDRRALVRFVTDRPGHDARYAIDASRSRRELSWSPEQSFESGIRNTVEWYLTHSAWTERIQSGAYRGERLGLGAAR